MHHFRHTTRLVYIEPKSRFVTHTLADTQLQSPSGYSFNWTCTAHVALSFSHFALAAVRLFPFIEVLFLHLLFSSSDALGNCFTLTNWWHSTNKAAAILVTHTHEGDAQTILYRAVAICLNSSVEQTFVAVYAHHASRKQRHLVVVCVHARVCVCMRPNEEREWKRHSIHVAHSSFSVGVRLQANQVLVKCALCKLFSVIFNQINYFKILFNLSLNQHKTKIQ